MRRETFIVDLRSLWFSVRELFSDEGVHLVLDAGGLFGVMKGKETEDGVELADLGDTQVLQVVQHTLCGGGEGRNYTHSVAETREWKAWVRDYRLVTPHTAEGFATRGGREACLDEDGKSLHGRTMVLHQHTEYIKCVVDL